MNTAPTFPLAWAGKLAKARAAFKRRYGYCGETRAEQVNDKTLRIWGGHLWLDFDMSAWRIRCVGGGSPDA